MLLTDFEAVRLFQRVSGAVFVKDKAVGAVSWSLTTV